MTNHRSVKVAEEIKREIAQMIRDDLKDPRLKGLISVTHVEVTNDLRYAKIFVSMYSQENDEKSAFKALEKASGYLRSELAKRLQLRYTPELIFKFDDSIQYGDKINKIISNINKSEKAEDEND